MTKQKRTRYQILGLVLFSFIIAVVSYGFAAANTSFSTPGLFGADYGVLSAYQVTNVSYIMDLEDPTSFFAVQFVIDSEDPAVVAGVSATKEGQITWAEDCEFSGLYRTCTFSEHISVLEADWLHLK